MSAQLEHLPLFPLETVLFPKGRLPLRVFEVRYLDMVRRCYQVGAPFGVVKLNQGSEVQSAGKTEAFESIGTLAKIHSLSHTQPGLLNVVCRGEQRFRVLKSERSQFGLWMAQVERIEDDQPLAIPPEQAPIAQALVHVGEQLKARGNGQLPEPYAFNDCAWVANRWAELLPLQTSIKQQLMQLESPLIRLELIGDTLQRLGLIQA